MRVSIITLFPKMVASFFQESIVNRAVKKKLVEIELINLRDFAIDKRGTVDDRPYGGGTGMILRVDAIHQALTQITNNQLPTIKQISTPKPQFPKQKILLTSPKGKRFNQQLAINYSKLDHLVIIAGHYEGVDQRVISFVDEEISLGDFILTGGEIVAAAITDAVVRLIPGVLKKNEATKTETFFSISTDQLINIVGENKLLKQLKNKGVKKLTLLEYPQYTRPENFLGKKVPPILLSGNHQEIKKWRIKKAFETTLKKRKDLLIKSAI